MNSDGTLLEGSVVLDSYFDPSLDLSCKRVKLASGQIVIYAGFPNGWFPTVGRSWSTSNPTQGG